MQTYLSLCAGRIGGRGFGQKHEGKMCVDLRVVHVSMCVDAILCMHSYVIIFICKHVRIQTHVQVYKYMIITKRWISYTHNIHIKIFSQEALS
jgi:hypothetical protein